MASSPTRRPGARLALNLLAAGLLVAFASVPATAATQSRASSFTCDPATGLLLSEVTTAL